jgi:hypothetical protein
LSDEQLSETEAKTAAPTVAAASRETACPRCGSREATTIAYGFPTDQMSEAARRGEVAIGGCLPMSAEWECRACGYGR